MRQGMIICLIAAMFCVLPVSAAEERAISVGVDARIELLSIVQLLSTYNERTGLITRFDLEYKKQAIERFAPFKNHRAVSLFDELSRAGFTFDAPVNAVLHLGLPPELPLRSEFNDYVCGRAGSRERLTEFVEALREFYQASNLQSFLDDHQEFYKELSAEAQSKMKGISIQMLEEYYGLRKGRYHIVLAPLLHPGGFGPQITLPDGSLDVFSVNGPHNHADGKPTFGDESNMRYLVWHEFSHSFMNPLVDRNKQAVQRTSALFEPLQAVMKRQAYNEWETCVKEHLVRAATVRFAFRELGDQAGQAALRHELSRGFTYVESLTERLKQYEAQRDKYKTIDDFAEQLLSVFEEAQQRSPNQAPAPRVINTVPSHQSNDVDPSMTELRVEFDQAMDSTGYSWVQNLGQGEFPETAGKARWVSDRVCVLPVKLKPGTRYWVGFNVGQFTAFRSVKGVIAQSAELSFTTRP